MSETDMNSQGQNPKTCRLAVWSLVLGILSFFTCLITAIPAIILGIVGLVKISNSSGKLKGNGLTIAGIALPVVLLPFVALILMPSRALINEVAWRMACGKNMSALGKAMLLYANDNDDTFPTPAKWCDLLLRLRYGELHPFQFVCPLSDAEEGSYAFNRNLIGKKPAEVPPDVVVLFETKGGWNQFGGPEILTTENHKGKGCNILFNNGRVEFVKPERLGELKWEVEEEEESGSGNFRKPGSDEEMKYWLENMAWYHRFTNEEISAATGLTEKSVVAVLKRFDIRPDNRPKRAKDAPLLVLPYPGGRHPRIGFLDGAIDPQRETKFSVFTPWDANSYVVVDVPEAIWSNLGLTYLAHTHIDTIWTKQDIVLPRLEWNRPPDGTLDIERKLPSGIVFGVKVRPETRAVRMELWLKNGTDRELSDLRVQNCVMTKMAAGFEQQSNDNKVFTNPYVACRSSDGKRWIITAWEGCNQPWGNERCPCFHSDPKFPDAEPGQTHRLRGWLSFYEGTDIEAEFNRIETTGWRRP